MPLVKDIHVDAVLTNISIATVNEDLVAPKVWPIVPVKKDSDIFFRYDLSNLRIDQTLWAPKTKANEINWNVSHEGYKTERHALQELVEDDEKDNQDSPLDVMSDSTAILTEKLMLRRERRLIDLLLAAASYPAGNDNTLNAGARWSNYTSATSDPSATVALGRALIAQTGHQANTMILPSAVYEIAREHPKVTDKIKYVQVGVITPALLSNLWDIKNVIIAGGIENAAIQGQPDNLQFMWGKNIWIGYVAPRAALRQASWGYHLQSQALQTERWRDDERKGEVIRVSYKDVPKLITPSAGCIFRSVIL